MVEKALDVSNLQIDKLKAIAVTIGPGQHGSLKVGLDYAKAIGIKFNLPVIPVNHLEAHIMTARMVEDVDKHMDFPFLSVLTTGAHTEIVLTRGIGLHTVFGFTLDIAVGTYLDRVAKEVMFR